MSKAAELARTLVSAGRQAALATLGEDGSPLATWVAYADAGDGQPLLLLSGLAEHTRNLRQRPRASLLVVSASPGSGGPMDRARVTLQGTVTFLDGDEAAAARQRFVAVNPDAHAYATLPDFTPARLEVESVRVVGGFARASVIPRDLYFATSPADPSRPSP